MPSKSKLSNLNSPNFEELLQKNNRFNSNFIEEVKPKSKRDYYLISAGGIFAVILMLVLSGLGILPSKSDPQLSPSGDISFQQQTSGQIALTESEMKSVIKKIGGEIYWAGEIEGSKYSVASQDASQVYIRYLPDGIIPANNEPNYRVIATYILENAFETTQRAGSSSANGVGFLTADGAAIYYNKNDANNIYLAYPNKNVQIEIFDPVAGEALRIATTPGLIKIIN
jgi:hypothetical protein